MDKAAEVLLALITGAFGLAIIAVILSKNAQTGSVLTSFGTALSGIINAAVSPINGSGSGSGLSLPNVPNFSGKFQ